MYDSSDIYQEVRNIDETSYSMRHKEYSVRRIQIVMAFFPVYGKKSYADLLVHLYSLPMSSAEISELIREKASVSITSRSIQRSLQASGVVLRQIKEAFGIAIKKGRVKWVYKEYNELKNGLRIFDPKTRFRILTRDGFRCVLCGKSKDDTRHYFRTLEVDHIVPRSKGGLNEDSNLRVLCHECNCGKRDFEREGQVSSCFVSPLVCYPSYAYEKNVKGHARVEGGRA